MTCKVTILIPTFQSAKFIRSFIESLLLQTFTDCSLIFSDDASTDNTYNICKSYLKDLSAKFHSVVMHQHMWNLGPAEFPGRNNHKFLFKEAAKLDSELTWLVDADDFARPHFLSTMVDYLEQNPEYAAAHSDVKYVNTDGSPGHEKFWEERSPYPMEVPTSYKFLNRDNRVFTSTFVCKSEVYRWAADYDLETSLGVFLGDYHISLRIASKYLIGYIDEPLVVYTNRHDSESHRISHNDLVKHTNYVKVLAEQRVGLD